GARTGRGERAGRERRRPKPVLDLASADEDEDEYTPQERLLADRIEKALDEESLDDAIGCADEALRCANAEIRQSMVDTLGWFGPRALPELTPFLADADEDVRESAMNEWSMAVSQIEDEAERIRTVELAMQVLDDEDALEDISGEYIGIDERLAVESIIRIVEAGRSAQGVEKAKETYEFVTGDEWTDVAEAERWIAEEYEPPESEEPAEEAEDVEVWEGE
ncbi:MAG: hypothetical protein ILO34_00820, partial [Kiritimatiellae bacterium]|nr:hypothetical protein [Kiritimatiellia bacterium]